MCVSIPNTSPPCHFYCFPFSVHQHYLFSSRRERLINFVFVHKSLSLSVLVYTSSASVYDAQRSKLKMSDIFGTKSKNTFIIHLKDLSVSVFVNAHLGNVSNRSSGGKQKIVKSVVRRVMCTAI